MANISLNAGREYSLSLTEMHILVKRGKARDKNEEGSTNTRILECRHDVSLGDR